MSAEDSEEQSEDLEDYGETVYLYRIPLETEGNTRTPAYSAGQSEERYLYHYGSTECVVIQDTAAGHLHKDDVNATVEELSKVEVEQSKDLVGDFV